MPFRCPLPVINKQENKCEQHIDAVCLLPGNDACGMID